MELPSIVEAILFVAERPVPLIELARVADAEPSEVEEALQELGSRLESGASALVVRNVAKGWRLYTRPEAFKYVEKFASGSTAARLSQAAMEALAVVAYKQPVSRLQVSKIRGVDSDSVLRTLERRGLIVETDRLQLPGNPSVYGTTELFMEKLSLNSLADLPPLADHVPPAGIVEKLEDTFRASE